MTDQPWQRQPASPGGPSRIITPTDTITITIDNRVSPAKISFMPSRVLPIPIVVDIFASLISKLMADMMQALSRPQTPALEPPTEPGTDRGPNGKT